MYRLLLEDVVGLDAESLGFPDDPDAQHSDVTALVVHTARRAGPTAAVLDYFDRQPAEHTRFDNLAGPNFVLSTALGQAAVEQVP